MTLPLSHVTVLDLSRALAGPYATALLADMGARIIKVESLNGGDTARQWPPFENDHSLYFDSVNRNKRSVCLDFYSEDGQDILRRLVEASDVLIENFKPGTLDKMGLTGTVLHELNPELIHASITGFGEQGPLKDLAGLDQVIQGMSGLISVTGSDPANTYRVGIPIIDITSGMVSAFSIVSALLGREKGHPVERVSTSLLETGLALSVFQGQKALSTGEAPAPQGNNHPVIAPYGAFATATSPITIAVGTERQWRDFCNLIDMPLLVEDPRFATGRDRTQNRAELTELIEKQLTHEDAETWVDRIRTAGIPCGPIYDYPQALATEHVDALNMVHHVQRADQTDLPLLRGPISLDGRPTGITSPPPLLGEHTSEVLHELGFDSPEIQDLLDAGAIRAAPRPVSASAGSNR